MKDTIREERIIAAGVTRTISDKTPGNLNTILFGGTGSGKTTGYVCPNLNHPSGSFVVSDTKGILYNKYRQSLANKGYDVILIDLVNTGNSFGYNPLSYIRRHRDGSIMESDIKKLATLIVPISAPDDPFWSQSATRVISMYIGFVMEAMPPEKQNMNEVLKFHRAYTAGIASDILEDFIFEHRDSYTARKYAMLSGMDKMEKTQRCIYEFVNESLDPFDCEEFASIFAAETPVNIHQLGIKKTALFINSSDHDRSYHVLSSIINSQILQTLIDDADKNHNGELELPVTLYLDDFAAAAKIPDFDMTISIIRSRNISVSIMLQSLSQLTHMYGKDSATTIINNCDTILYLGGGHDLETAEFISSHINVTPHSVLNLPRDKAILITSGEEPRRVDKIKATDEITGLTA